jgi:hypothetical protein
MGIVITKVRRSARVRPYAITGGRTKTRQPLLLETLISVPQFDPRLSNALIPESWRIYEFCQERKSITEIAAWLRIPLGVVRVLVSDLADQDRIRVHPSGSATAQSHRELLERVLRGLQSVS